MKKLMYKFTSIMLFTFTMYPQDLSYLPDPYNKLITLLPFDNHGWYINGAYIEKLFQYNDIKIVIEVGSWLGSSTRHMAYLLPNNGQIYAVDTWLGSIENYNQEEGFSRIPTLYEQFLSNIVHMGLTHKVIPNRMPSIIAANVLSVLKNKVDLIYIDADHDTESVYQDLQAWSSYVSDNNGILCGDDWWYEGVQKAVRMFALKYQFTIFYGNNFWFLKKSKEFNEESFLYKDDSVWIVKATEKTLLSSNL